jgi:hypothetical protein
MKCNFIIHNPTNFYTKKYRYYNIFFDNLVDTISQKHDVIQNRYYIDSHSKFFTTTLLCNKTIHLKECEMIIENFDTHEIKILSISDQLSPLVLNLFNDADSKSSITKVLICQFDKNNIQNHCNSDISNIYSPWIYFPFNDYSFDLFFNKRKTLKLINKLYFRGSGLEHRPIVKYLKNYDKFHGGNPIGPFNLYAEEAIKYSIGLSCAGVGQFCYRDIEYMAMGIPFLRFEFNNELYPNLIPDFHYISAGPKISLNAEHNANIDIVEKLISKFEAICTDQDFLSYIAHNAREYYLNYIQSPNSVYHTCKLLGITL